MVHVAMWSRKAIMPARFRRAFRQYSIRSRLIGANNRVGSVALFVMASIVSTELMWLIRLRNQRDDFARTLDTQIGIRERLIRKLKEGQSVDLEKELAQVHQQPDDEQVIISQLESLEREWAQQIAATTATTFSGAAAAVKSRDSSEHKPTTGKYL